MTPAERFWLRVLVGSEEECWPWTGPPSNRGYGQITVDGRTVGAHRFSYLEHGGCIPAGHDVDHLCRNRLCVNPNHLEAVDHRTNLLRGSGFVAINAAKTHCPRGHEYTAENTYVNPHPDGGRICRTCKRERDRAFRQRKRLEVDHPEAVA